MPTGTKPPVKQPIDLNIMSPTIPSKDISMEGRMGGYNTLCNPSVSNVTQSVTSKTSKFVTCEI